MTQKIIVHCGAPKTGSTSFQHLLYAHRQKLLDAGFWCPDVSRKKRVTDDIRILLSDLSREPGGRKARIAHARSVIDGLFRSSGAHTLIISNESLLGKPFVKGSQGFLPRAIDQAPLLAEVLAGYDVELRFFVRDYAGFLPSWYVQQVRMGERDDFDAFLGRFDLSQISWRPAVAALRAAFPGRLAVFDHAEMKNGAHLLMAKAFPAVMAALGEDGNDLPNKNISIGRGMVDRYRRWNSVVHRLPLKLKTRNALRQFGRRYGLLPLERFSNSEKIALEPAMAAEMKARFAADLAWIRQSEGS